MIWENIRRSQSTKNIYNYTEVRRRLLFEIAYSFTEVLSSSALFGRYAADHMILVDEWMDGKKNWKCFWRWISIWKVDCLMITQESARHFWPFLWVEIIAERILSQGGTAGKPILSSIPMVTTANFVGGVRFLYFWSPGFFTCTKLFKYIQCWMQYKYWNVSNLTSVKSRLGEHATMRRNLAWLNTSLMMFN